MLSVKNNYYLSDNFAEINKFVFEFEVIDLINRSETIKIIYRKKKNSSNSKFIFSKSGLATELKGFFEIWGTNTINVKDLGKILFDIDALIQKYKPGVILFKNFYINPNENLSVNKLFFSHNYERRNWKTKILDIDYFLSKKSEDRFNKKIKKDILKISSDDIDIIEVDNKKKFDLFLDLFFNSEGHSDYPEQKNLYKDISWNLYKIHHKFFIIKKKNEYLGVFGVRIYKDLASLIMIGRNKILKNSIHSFSIDFLIKYLGKKGIKFLDLTGFNPSPYNKKEEGIKFFKERFYGEEVFIPTFVKDNTKFVKYLRKFFNILNNKNKLADQNWIN